MESHSYLPTINPQRITRTATFFALGWNYINSLGYTKTLELNGPALRPLAGPVTLHKERLTTLALQGSYED